MKEFSVFINEQELLLEKLITFGNRAYPKFNNVVILAGGAGSGKGFTQETILGIEGRVFDVDRIKKLAMASTLVAANILKTSGVDVKKLNLRNPEDVSLLHNLLYDTPYVDQAERLMYKNLGDPARLGTLVKGGSANIEDRKPNLIFDTTLSNTSKIKDICESVIDVGYEKKNIHVVWVLNDINMAISQNATRSRVVPSDILMATHVGANSTFSQLIDKSSGFMRYLDGDIWISFNKFGIDAKLINPESKEDSIMWKGKERLITKVGEDERVKSGVFKTKTTGKGMFLPEVLFIKVKEQGKKTRGKKDISRRSIRKIKEYVPNPEAWS